MDDIMTIARTTGPRGDIAIRRRGPSDDGVFELIVNGVFAMDTVETRTERELARYALEQVPEAGPVLVGGLGLGFTAAEVLDHGVSRVDVVEIEEPLIRWARKGLTPMLASIADDHRTHLYAADLHDVLLGDGPPPGPWAAILFDVDNGPDFLIHGPNARLYSDDQLTSAYDRLTPGGVLAIWCQGPSPDLLTTLRRLSADAAEHLFEVERDGRQLTYVIYTARSAGPAG